MERRIKVSNKKKTKKKKNRIYTLALTIFTKKEMMDDTTIICMKDHWSIDRKDEKNKAGYTAIQSRTVGQEL